MTAIEAAAIMDRCDSLAEADRLLAPFSSSRWMRWGMWDAYKGLPKSTAGIVSENSAMTPRQKSWVDQYLDGYAIGGTLAKKG